MSIELGWRDRSRTGFSWRSRAGVVDCAPWEVAAIGSGYGGVALTRLGMNWTNRQLSPGGSGTVFSVAWSPLRKEWALTRGMSVRVLDRWGQEIWSFEFEPMFAAPLCTWGPGGELVVALGFSTTAWGGAEAQLLRFDADLELDWSYDTAGGMVVQFVAVDADGAIYVAGPAGTEIAQRVSAAGAKVWGSSSEVAHESYMTTVTGLAVNASGAYVAGGVDWWASGNRVLRLDLSDGSIGPTASYGPDAITGGVAAGDDLVAVVVHDSTAYPDVEYRIDRYGVGLGAAADGVVFDQGVGAIALAHDGRHVYAGVLDSRVHRVDAATWAEERVGPALPASPLGLAVNPGVWVE